MTAIYNNMTELEETKQYRLSARKNASLLSVDKNQDLLNNVLYSNEYYNTVALSYNKQTRGYKLFHKNEIFNFPNNKQLDNYLEKIKEKMRQHRQDNPTRFKQYQKAQEKHSRDTRKEKERCRNELLFEEQVQSFYDIVY